MVLHFYLSQLKIFGSFHLAQCFPLPSDYPGIQENLYADLAEIIEPVKKHMAKLYGEMDLRSTPIFALI